MMRSVYKTELYKSPKIELKRSSKHGWGVFANAPIQQHEILEESPIIIVEPDELSNPYNLQRYFAALKDGAVSIGLGYAALYNHSPDANVAWYIDGVNYIQVYYALRDIEAGEELCSNYGPVGVNFEPKE
jgi:uncharacterized protein